MGYFSIFQVRSHFENKRENKWKINDQEFKASELKPLSSSDGWRILWYEVSAKVISKAKNTKCKKIKLYLHNAQALGR